MRALTNNSETRTETARAVFLNQISPWKLPCLHKTVL